MGLTGVCTRLPADTGVLGVVAAAATGVTGLSTGVTSLSTGLTGTAVGVATFAGSSISMAT